MANSTGRLEKKHALDNKPHIEYFFSTRIMAFILFHLQNFCWTIESFIDSFSKNSRHSKGSLNYLLAGKARNQWSSPDTDSELLDPGHDSLIKNFTMKYEFHQRDEIRNSVACKQISALPIPESMKKNIAIIMPSRLMKCKGVQSEATYMLEVAINSVKNQRKNYLCSFSFIIGIDVDVDVPVELSRRHDITFVNSNGKSQVLALNAAIALVDEKYDYVGFLEDDDQWHEDYISWALLALSEFDFVSSTQLEINEAGDFLYISDFPTPSGWLMSRSTLNIIGGFDLQSKWHLDNEWLGRLAESGLTRCHLVEATAPTTIRTAFYRSGIAELIKNSGPNMNLRRHLFDVPLVKRLVHPGSGMFNISLGGVAASESELEYKRLVERFGHVPW